MDFRVLLRGLNQRIARRAQSVAVIAVLALLPIAHAQSSDAEPASQPDNTAKTTQADTRSDPDPDLADPEKAMFHFLESMARVRETHGDARRTAINEALKTFDFEDVELRTAREEIASQLLGILDRINEVSPRQFISAFMSDEPRFVYFPQDRFRRHRAIHEVAPDGVIALERNDIGEWRFTADTVAGIPELFRAIEHLPVVAGEGEITLTTAMDIRRRVPPALRQAPIAGVEYWQWIGLLTIIAAGFLLDLLLRTVLASLWRGVARRRGGEADPDVLRRAVRPFGMLAAAGVGWLLLPALGLPPTAITVCMVAIKIILAFSSVWAAYRLTDLFTDLLASKAAQTTTKFDDILVPMLRRVLKVFVTAIGLIYVAEAFDVEVLPLLTGLGIGGLAVAFAAKDTIENFFGSIAVVIDRPFEVGDWIDTNGVEGTVEYLGLRSTRVRTFYNSLVTLPNATLVRANVDNYGRRRYRRFKTMLSLTYDTPPDKIEAFCEGVREIIRLHPYTRKDYYHVWLNSFGAHSLDVLLYMFHECPDWSIELRERHRLMLDIIRLADRLGVSFAFPTQTVEFRNMDFASPHQPIANPPSTAETDARRTGIAAARELTGDQPWKQHKPGPVLFTAPSTEEHEARGDSGES